MSLSVSGSAIATSLGVGPAATVDALLEGRSGIGPFRHPDAPRFRTTLGFELPDDGGVAYLRASRWITRLIREALLDAGIDPHAIDGSRLAVVVGSSLRELNTVEKWATGRGAIIAPDALSFHAAAVEAVGPVRVLSVLGACAAGLMAVGTASDLLETREADIVVVVSIETVSSALTAMYDRVATEIADRIRPFDVARRGTIFGEGAAAVVLERSRESDRRPRALVLGVGSSSDAKRSTAPDTNGLVAAMRDAHTRARVTGEDIDVVFTHGTGTARNDVAEADALTRLRCTRATVTSLKPMVGHTLASSGLVSFVVAVECLQRGVIPPTLHLTDPDPAVAHLTIATAPVVGAELRYAQVDAFGFGGINSVAVLERAS